MCCVDRLRWQQKRPVLIVTGNVCCTIESGLTWRQGAESALCQFRTLIEVCENDDYCRWLSAPMLLRPRPNCQPVIDR